ncbi:MAG: hypothetical protein HY036_06080 [Nitrospirae bacterium]|nr:hypothetical protein [Nitrospirota bacterium]MBI3352130.1 hypothetical protein [Nitrospirota bacterium]
MIASPVAGFLPIRAFRLTITSFPRPGTVKAFLAYTGTLSIATADSADLTTVPTLVDPAMGTIPNITIVKYSEGKLVQ